MGTNYDFIELYNMTGNRFFGGFSCLEAAKPPQDKLREKGALDKLREKGELPAINHALLMYEYRHAKNQGYVRTGIRTIHYRNGWRIKK